ncbi:MAG: hypothetical protein M3Q73_03775 [bacterium]|nr:hypothetical protein [bacterium]
MAQGTQKADTYEKRLIQTNDRLRTSLSESEVTIQRHLAEIERLKNEIINLGQENQRLVTLAKALQAAHGEIGRLAVDNGVSWMSRVQRAKEISNTAITGIITSHGNE